MLHYYTEKTTDLYQKFEEIETVFNSPSFRDLGDKYPINDLKVEYNANDLICTFTITRYVRWVEEEPTMQILERIGETSHGNE